MPKKSIRLRLLLWFGLFLALLIAGFGVAVFQIQKITRMKEIDADLAQRVDLVGGAFRMGDFKPRPPPIDGIDPRGSRPPPPHGPGTPPTRHGMRAPIAIPADVSSQFNAGNGCYFAVWGDREKALLAQSAPQMDPIPRPDSSSRQTLLRLRMRGSFREAYQFTERRDCVLVGCNVGPVLAELRNLAWKIAAAGFLVLLLGLGGGFLVSALLLDSIRQISGTALRISEGNLSERIATGDMDRELGQLADVLNATFARLEAAFARQQQFTADAAHELRTPLAVIISEAQTALRRERGAEEYREAIRSCEEAAQKMRRLADSLLMLARLDSGAEQGPRTLVDLGLVAQETIERLQPLASERGLRIQMDLKPAGISGHAEQIGRVFTNLLMNALEYNRPGGTIAVSTGTDQDRASAVVADTGEGILAEDLPHIFDRFYRPVSSRSRADGHAGLGLAICKAIVEAHGGQIEATSAPGAGTVVTLRWPAAAAPG